MKNRKRIYLKSDAWNDITENFSIYINSDGLIEMALLNGNLVRPYRHIKGTYSIEGKAGVMTKRQFHDWTRLDQLSWH